MESKVFFNMFSIIFLARFSILLAYLAGFIVFSGIEFVFISVQFSGSDFLFVSL